MKTQKTVRTAIIGCGDISNIYFQNMINKFSILDVVKCCSRNGATAREKAIQYGIECSTLEEIMADPSIELIVNLTPAPQHVSIIKAALEAGKHVYTEKVITPDLASAQELKRMADEKGLYLCVAPDNFLGSAWQCARELIDSGIMGEITSVSGMVCHDIDISGERLAFINEPAGGIGFDFGIYFTTAVVSLLGPVVEVCGMAQTRFPKRVHKEATRADFGESFTYINEDIMVGSMKFANGAYGTIHFNGNSIVTPPAQFQINGTKGVLSLPNPGMFSGEVALYRVGSREPVIQIPAHGLNHDSRSVGVADMAWAIRHKRPARTTAEMGIHCFEILEGMVTSSRQKNYYQMTTTCRQPAALSPGYMGMEKFSFSEEGALVL